MFLTESWFWRGTQSAIFYYVSCTPCLESKYKRQRRKDAIRSEKEKAEIITTQPGILVQPGPFQTNPDWAEEIIRGPGPPKGWKKEKILKGYTESEREKYRTETQVPRLPLKYAAYTTLDGTLNKVVVMDVEGRSVPTMNYSIPVATAPTSHQLSSVPLAERMSPISEMTSETMSSTSSSDQPDQGNKSRPSVERRLSTAVGNLKETLKGWNLKRYEREDEILSGLNERLIRMWDRATHYGLGSGIESNKTTGVHGRKRGATNESDRYDYLRAIRNPEINEMHPPVVSRLPATRDAAAWMLLPPPSAAVMAGRTRPQDEPYLRWPLAQIGRNADEWEQIKKSGTVQRHRLSNSTSSTGESKRIPDLSNSSSDEGWSDREDEDEAEYYMNHNKGLTNPIEGMGAGHMKLSCAMIGWTPAQTRAQRV